MISYIYDYGQSDYELILIPKPIGVIHKYFDTQTNVGYSLVLSQWGLFIGILIPKPMGVIHWYSDTQTFIGILIPKSIRVIHSYSDTQPMEVIHWYSDTQTNGGCSLAF